MAYGQEATADSTEKFVPQSAMVSGAGTLELRSDATIIGTEIKLKQICRWSDGDANAFMPVSDLVIDRIDANGKYRSISLDDLRKTLSDAGVNTAVIRFAGATACAVARGDIEGGDRAALQQWLNGKNGDEKKDTGSDERSPTQAIAETLKKPGNSGAADASPIVTLRDKLLTDLSQRLNLPVEQLQVNFSSKDANLLNLAEPVYQFDIQARRVRDLGDVIWDVGIVSGGAQQKVTVSAEARAWQEQIVAARSVAFKSIIQPDDLTERRVLIEHVDEAAPLLTKEQTVGQAAARDLQTGMLMTARLVESVPLVKTGQYVTVTLNQGSVRVKTVAKAMESGSFGQTIRVRNEETHDVFEVTMTGPQLATMGEAPGVASLASGRESN